MVTHIEGICCSPRKGCVLICIVQNVFRGKRRKSFFDDFLTSLFDSQALETRKSHYSKTSRGGQYYKLSLFTTRTKSYTISILNHKMNRKLRSFKVDKIVVPSWIRLHLPSCHPGFEYQAHHLCFLLSKFVLYLSLC